MSVRLENLLSSIRIGNTHIKNRIVSTGHHTYLADRVPGEELIAYHRERAEGGVGLIVTEIIAVHASAGFSSKLLTFDSDDAIDHYRRLTEVCHAQDCKVFAQLFHPGREILSSPGGHAALAWGPSAVPNERFHIMPKPMSISLIEEIIAGYGNVASGLLQAGFDGVEILGSHGYLPAQFLSPNTNLRDDKYGGDFERRLCFLREVISRVQADAPGLTVGVRLSADDCEPEGLDERAMISICQAIEADVDYFSFVVGSSATLGASQHITPAMGFDSRYVADKVAPLKTQLNKPVMVTGRINQPQVAEQILAEGLADMCGMTRALICDPRMPEKAAVGSLDTIRACIGCNQACIGRAHKGLPISCIQFPESGREHLLGPAAAISGRKRVVVVGAGPAGLKTAAVAAARGHHVQVFEQAERPGGQVLLAQLLPGRAEFGGLIDNLMVEIKTAGVELNCGQALDANALVDLAADEVVLATGAKPYVPTLALDDSFSFSYADILSGRKKAGHSVVIADWKADWIGIGLAEQLASEGSRVRLVVNAAMAGESLQLYTRNHYVARLYRLGVEILPYLRLFGSDGRTVYLQNTLSDEAVILEDVDSLVLSLGHQACNSLETDLLQRGIVPRVVGDCLLPRTAEEAVYEAMLAGRAL